MCCWHSAAVRCTVPPSLLGPRSEVLVMTRCRAERCMDGVLSCALLLISRIWPSCGNHMAIISWNALASTDVCSMVAVVHSSLLVTAGC